MEFGTSGICIPRIRFVSAKLRVSDKLVPFIELELSNSVDDVMLEIFKNSLFVQIEGISNP